MNKITIEIDKDKIYKECGIDIANSYEYLLYIKNLCEFLESHNKNYTKEQYYAILDIKTILDNIKGV